MKHIARGLTLVVSLIVVPALADDDTVAGPFQVGSTGILCVKAPCPWVGIMPLSGDTKDPRRWPLFSGERPPELVGADAERTRVEGAWSIEGCLIVDGVFHRSAARLEISRVVRDCRG